MSHLDELDEFEAELELRLKKEYSDVFGLFRYCVMTQDATYLCNRIEVEQLTHTGRPFFRMRLEDVWVWDQNRPSRMIPRTDVFTSRDYAIEELREEGDDATLAFDALSRRVEQLRETDDDDRN